MSMTNTYDIARTAFVLVDPYNDFFAEDGKIYPRLKDVAESVGLHEHIPDTYQQVAKMIKRRILFGHTSRTRYPYRERVSPDLRGSTCHRQACRRYLAR